MLVSIIVPVYNREKFIQICIESLQMQTYKDIEIIIVDDGSTDKTYAICKKMAEEDSRIILVKQENAGAGEARNTGLDIAKGDYYVFIDSDDYLIPEAVEILVNSLKKTDYRVKMACADFIDGFEEGKPDIPHPNTWEEIIVSKEEAFRELVFERPVRWVTLIWKIYAAELFNDIRFPKGLRIYEDTYVTYLLMGKCEEMVKIELPIYYYRHHQGSVMIQFGMKEYAPLYRGYMDRAIWLRKNNMDSIYHLQRQFIEDRLRKDYAECVQTQKKEDIKELRRIHRQYFKENFFFLPLNQKIKRTVKCLIGSV